jgi:Protein of unknown function (DUF3313)
MQPIRARSVIFFPLLLMAAAVLAQSASQKKDIAAALSVDGLREIKVKGIDMAFARPDASLTGYTKVMLDPVSVSFHKNWNPTVPGSRFKLSTQQQEEIRSGVGKLVYDTFVDELQKHGYDVVTTAGPDVLEVQAAIINLYVTAPDVPTAGRVRTYTVSAGEMTLVAALADSETGELIARVYDRTQARESANFSVSSRVFNVAEARTAAASWAKILRVALDNARSSVKD